MYRNFNETVVHTEILFKNSYRNTANGILLYVVLKKSHKIGLFFGESNPDISGPDTQGFMVLLFKLFV